MKVSEFQDRLQKFSTSTGTSSSWRFLNKVVNTLVQTAAGTDDTSLPSIPSTTPSQKPSLPPTHQSSYSTPILNSNKPKDPLPPSVPTSKDDTAKPKLESKSSNLNFNPFDPPDTPSSPQTSKLNSAKSVPLKQENTNTDTKKSESGSPSNNKPQDNKSGLFKWIGGLIKIPNRPKQVNLGSNDEYTWHPGHQLFIPPGEDPDEYAARIKQKSAPPPPTSAAATTQPAGAPAPTPSPAAVTTGPANLLVPRASVARKKRGEAAAVVQPGNKFVSKPLQPSALNLPMFIPTVPVDSSVPAFEEPTYQEPEVPSEAEPPVEQTQ